MKKVRIKRSVKAKFILFLILALIMAALIIGELVVAKKTAENPSITTALTTDAQDEITTEEPETQNQTEPETAPPTEAETTAQAPAPPQTGSESPVTVDPTGEKWELTLVNLTHILPENYVPSLGNAVTGSAVKMDSRAAQKYQEMYDAAKKDGCVLTPYSGYTSVSRQNDNYLRKVNYFVSQGLSEDDAKKKASAVILPGGCSEHNLGLSMDIVSASTDFASTKEFGWLVKNAANYGFILRYPENKVDKTGVNYQPWHWRYVGVSEAKKMAQSGQCLEEYLGA